MRFANGLDNADFFHALTDKTNTARDLHASFRASAQEATGRAPEALPGSRDRDVEALEPNGKSFSSKQRNIGDVGTSKVVASVGSFLDALFFDLTTLGSAPRGHAEQTTDTRDLFEISAEEATKQVQFDQQRQYDEEWRQRSKQSYGE